MPQNNIFVDMKDLQKTRNAPSEALIALRKAMGKTQQTFAVEVLKSAIGTVARYETSDPPQGDLLLRLAEIAGHHKLIHLRDVFRRLYFEEVKRKLGFDLMTIAKTETEPAHGCLMLHLDGEEALRLAQIVVILNAQLASDNPKIRQNAISGVSSLQITARKYGNPAVGEIQDAFRSAQTGRLQTSTAKTKRHTKQSS
jgi:transcriptional regulator with XRE-family HTH domain